MKNIKPEIHDSLRPEYKRSDFGEFVRGAVTQVEFAERVSLLLSCIREDEGIEFGHHSIGNYLANQQLGDWTYEIDNGNQVTLRYWLDSLGNIEVKITNPPCIVTAEDNNNLINALTAGVRVLKAKVADRTST
jgi:hypothetical protein